MCVAYIDNTWTNFSCFIEDTESLVVTDAEGEMGGGRISPPRIGKNVFLPNFWAYELNKWASVNISTVLPGGRYLLYIFFHRRYPLEVKVAPRDGTTYMHFVVFFQRTYTCTTKNEFLRIIF